MTELAPGYFTPEITWLWRKHDNNTTGTATWRSKPCQASYQMCAQRTEAIRELGLALAAQTRNLSTAASPRGAGE